MPRHMNSMRSSSCSIFRHAFSQAVAENGTLLFLGIVVFCVLIPVSTAGLPATSIFNVDYTHDQMKLRFFAESFAPAVNYGALIYGALAGIMLFRFLLDKRQTASILTLGLSRRALFLSRYSAGAVLTTISLLVPMLASLCLNIAAFGFSTRMLSFFCYCCLGLLLLGLNGLALSGIACALAGTLGESLFFSGVLMTLPTALCYGVGTLMRLLLLGNAYGACTYNGTTEIQSNLIELFSKWNPAMFFLQSLRQYSVYFEGGNSASPQSVSFSLPLLWIPATAVLAVVALCLFRARRAEKAGISGLSRTVRLCGLSVPGFALFAAVTDALAKFSLPAALVSATVSYLAWSLVLGCLTYGKASIAHRQLEMLPQLAAVWIVTLVLLCGGLGFSSYTPPAARVSSVRVSYVGSPDYLSSAQGSSTGGGYYVMSSYTYTNQSDIEAALSLHRNFIAMGRRDIGENDTDFTDTVLPYDVVFQYTLSNGSVKTRYYDRAEVTVLARMLTLDATNEVKEAERQTVTGNGGKTSSNWAAGAFASGDIYLTDSWYVSPTLLRLSEKDRAVLRENIAKDVEAQDIDDRYFPKTPPVCVLMFTQNGEADSQNFGYQLQNSLVHVTYGFTNTLEFLKEHGLDSFPASGETIESVSLQKYEPFRRINGQVKPRSLYFQSYVSAVASDFITTQDFGRPYEVTDADKIRALAPRLRNDYFMSDGGYLASIKLAGSNKYVYKFLPAADAPEYITQSLG